MKGVFFSGRQRRCGRLFFCLSLGIFFLARAHAQSVPPPLTAPVMDTAHLVDEDTAHKLNARLIAVREQTGVQIAVLTVPSLNGEPIDEYGTRIAQAWQLGQKGKDNGVLLTVAQEERKMRIDVGYGLEGLLTDTTCGIIIRRYLKPAFAAEAYGKGIQDGIDAIIGVLTQDGAVTAQLERYARRQKRNDWIGISIPFVMFGSVLLFIFVDARRRRRIKKNTALQTEWTFPADYSADSASDDVSADADESDYSGDGGDFGGGGASDGW